MDMQTIWEKTKPLLENSMTQVMYDFHIETTTPISLENGVLTLMAKGDFNKNSLKTRYFHEIRNYARSASGIDDLEINIVSPEDFNNVENSQTKLSNYNYEKTNLQQKYVFETFVKGKCNELAYNAAKAVSETPESSNYNPLFLYGGVGLGKTHLVHSIGNRVLELFPELKIVYVSSETFTNELVTAIREQTTQQFKDKYRKVDILIVDDVQFLVGKDQTQEEMFHTFNELYSANKQIILTSDLPPKELTGLETRLTSRFAAGLIADVSIPDYETRTAILEKKLHSEKIEIPQTVKEFITRNIVSNIRDLEGALNKIMAYANLNNTPLTLELAQQALKDQLVNAEKPEITMEYIQQIVATHFKITTEDLNSKKRTQSIVFPRQIAMYLCRKILPNISFPQVGMDFGGRDHTTVMHSCEKISIELENDNHLQNVILDLERRILEEG